MGYDVTRFVVGDEWVYRLMTTPRPGESESLAIMPKGRPSLHRRSNERVNNSRSHLRVTPKR